MICFSLEHRSEENEQIKVGESITSWPEAKRRQKDTDARWTKKNGKSFFGYKNHISVGVDHKLIRSYEVSDASVHDRQVFTELLDSTTPVMMSGGFSLSLRGIFLQELAAQGFCEHLQRKGCWYKKLTAREKQGNSCRSRTRSRIEHVFGGMAMRTVRTVRPGD